MLYANTSTQPLPMYSKHNYIMLGMFYGVYYVTCTLVSRCSGCTCNIVAHALLLAYDNTESAAAVTNEK